MSAVFRRIGWLVNPHARGCTNWYMAAMLQKKAGDGQVWATESLEELEERIAECLENGMDIGGIGGDGTQHKIIDSVIKQCQEKGIPIPKFVFAHLGTKHVIANYLNPKVDVDDLVSFFGSMSDSAEVPTRMLRPLMIKTESEILYGFMYAGGGCLSNFYEEYYGGGTPGDWTEKKIIAKGALSLALEKLTRGVVVGSYIRRMTRPIPAQVSITSSEDQDKSEEVNENQFNFITASPYNFSIAGLKPYHSGIRKGSSMTDTPEVFHFLAGNLTPVQAIGTVPNVLLGVPIGIDGICDRLVTAADIRFNGNGETDYILDGDEYKAERLSLSLGPELEVFSIY